MTPPGDGWAQDIGAIQTKVGVAANHQSRIARDFEPLGAGSRLTIPPSSIVAAEKYLLKTLNPYNTRAPTSRSCPNPTISVATLLFVPNAETVTRRAAAEGGPAQRDERRRRRDGMADGRARGVQAASAVGVGAVRAADHLGHREWNGQVQTVQVQHTLEGSGS